MESVRAAYGEMAAQYIDLFATTSAMRRDDLDLIERASSGVSGAVLDVGCGPGHLTVHLRSLGIDTIGVDLVPEFIDHARAVDPRGRYLLGAIPHLPVPDAAASGLVAWYSLIHLPPSCIDAALAELRRTIAPGGTLVVGFFAGTTQRSFAHAVTTAYCWPVDEMSARLVRAGFAPTSHEERAGVDEAGRRPHGAVVAVAV